MATPHPIPKADPEGRHLLAQPTKAPDSQPCMTPGSWRQWGTSLKDTGGEPWAVKPSQDSGARVPCVRSRGGWGGQGGSEQRGGPASVTGVCLGDCESQQSLPWEEATLGEPAPTSDTKTWGLIAKLTPQQCSPSLPPNFLWEEAPREKRQNRQNPKQGVRRAWQDRPSLSPPLGLPRETKWGLDRPALAQR